MKYGYYVESFIKDKDDILYNKDKFDSGEINLLFITGLSGSGKSTLSRNIKNKITVDMDKVIMYNYREEAFFRNEGPVVNGFFKGIGKKYRITEEEKKKQIRSGKINTINKEITKDLIRYTIQYAKSHRDKNIVIDGVWLFMYCDPAAFKDYAVYIKGTSALTSGRRAGKRGSNNDNAKTDKLSRTVYSINRIFTDLKEEAVGGINKWRKYYAPLYKQQIAECIELTDLEYRAIIESRS